MASLLPATFLARSLRSSFSALRSHSLVASHGAGCACPIHKPIRPKSSKVDTSYANLEDILQNNQRWVKEMTDKDPRFFKRLASGQKPKYFYIGCADSRVPANEIMGLGPGEVFVHRNVANMVVGTDASLLACLQFAVERLGVEHIIGMNAALSLLMLVCGHYDCGGVRAAISNKDHGTIEQW
jgi:carbonic anhydrase